MRRVCAVWRECESVRVTGATPPRARTETDGPWAMAGGGSVATPSKALVCVPQLPQSAEPESECAVLQLRESACVRVARVRVGDACVRVCWETQTVWFFGVESSIGFYGLEKEACVCV